MRIAYLVKVLPSRDLNLIQKCCDQINTWKKLDHDTHIKIFYLNQGASKTTCLDNLETSQYAIGNKWWFEIFHLNKTYRKLLNDLAEFRPDLVYTRTWSSRKFTQQLTQTYKVISEVNTVELKEYLAQKATNKIKFLKYVYVLLTQHLFYKNLSGLVCVTNEIAQEYSKYELPTYVIPNSIPINNYNIQTPQKNKIPKIFFIGSPGMPWQGFDKVLKLAKLTLGKLEFHLVGNTNTYDKSWPPNIISYGIQDYENYKPILNNCDVGLGTMALQRKGLKEACPLKIREYLAYGLPIILPYDDTAFLEDNPIWALKLPGEEGASLEPDQIERIVTFSYKMMGYRVAHEESSKYVDSTYWKKKE